MYPQFRKTVEGSGEEGFRLDVMVEASGFGRKEMRVLGEVPIVFLIYFFSCCINSRQYMESQDEQEESMEEEGESNEAESEEAETSEKENPVDMTGLKMEDAAASRSQEDDRKARIKEIVSLDVAKRKGQELRKHHSRRSTRSAGRAQGSKAKYQI